MLHRTAGAFRAALRGLARTPSTAALAVAAVALGIGGAVTVFSAVNAAFLTALPYPDADRVVAVWQTSPRASRIAVAYPVMKDWSRELDGIEAMAGYSGPQTVNLAPDAGPGGTARVTTLSTVTSGYFTALGVRPVLGRTFGTDDERAGAPVVAVISYRLWQGFFGGDPAAVSRDLVIEGARVPVIGVMPPRVNLPGDTDIWTSAEVDADDYWSRTAHNFRVVARLAPGHTPASMTADITALQARLDMTYPGDREDLGVRAVPLRGELLGDASTVIGLLFTSVLLLLVIACANVANLLMARAAGRRGETALRRALGAGGTAAIAPVIAEAVVVTVTGSIAGVLLAMWGRHLLEAVVPASLVGPGDLALDSRVLLFAVAASAVTCVVSSVLPALSLARTDLRGVLAAGSRSVAAPGHRAMRTFIGVQVALAALLLASAALFARGLAYVERLDPGFRSSDVVYSSFAIGTTPGSRYQAPEARVSFFSSLLDGVAGLPGVVSVGLTDDLPFEGGSNGAFQIEGRPDIPRSSLYFRLVGGHFFDTVGIRLRQGRLLDDRDTAGRPPSALVNERAARMYWPDGSAIGARIRMPSMDLDDTWYTVVGIVEDARYSSLLREPVPEVYFPFDQRPSRTWRMNLVARVTGAAGPYVRSIGDVIHRLDPGMPADVAPLHGPVDEAAAPARFRATLAGAFGVTALLLSVVGIFGVVSHVVAERTREVGIRMALGADTGSVRRAMMKRALGPAAVGLMAGLALVLALGRFAEALLPGIGTRDPLAIGVALGLLAGAVTAASWWPARRASGLDPLDALRDT